MSCFIKITLYEQLTWHYKGKEKKTKRNLEFIYN